MNIFSDNVLDSFIIDENAHEYVIDSINFYKHESMDLKLSSPRLVTKVYPDVLPRRVSNISLFNH